MRDLYELKLFEEIELDKYRHIVRVPGGWIYKEFAGDDNEYSVSICFIPYSKEFLIKEE